MSPRDRFRKRLWQLPVCTCLFLDYSIFICGWGLLVNCMIFTITALFISVWIYELMCLCIFLCVSACVCACAIWLVLDVRALEDYVYRTFLAGELTHGDRCSPLAHNPCSNYPTLAGTVQYCTEDINIYDCIKFSNHHHNYHHHHIVIVDFFKSFFGINVLLTRSCIDVVGDESQSVNSLKFMCCI